MTHIAKFVTGAAWGAVMTAIGGAALAMNFGGVAVPGFAVVAFVSVLTGLASVMGGIDP